MILKQLFCKHKYRQVEEINCVYITDNKEIECPISLLECCKCKKRLIIKDADFYYRKTLLRELELWKKHQIERRLKENDR